MYLKISMLVILFLSGLAYAETEPLKVGAIIGLSGSMSQTGLEMKKGMEIALKDLGEPAPIQIIFEDDQSMEQSVAVSAISKLINLDKVKAVFTWVNTTIPSIAPIATRAKVPLIEFWDSNEGMFSLSPYVFCSGFSTEKSGARIAKFAMQAKHNKKLGIIIANDPWSELIAQSFKKEVLKEGGEIVFEERVDPEEKDVKALVLKIRKSGAEGIYAPLFMGSLYASIRQLKELQFKGDIYTGDAFIEGDINVLGKFAEGVYSHQIVFDDQNFISKYKSMFGANPSNIGAGYAALGYDAILILSVTLKNLKEKGLDPTSENIKTELETLRYEGLTGTSVLHGTSEKVEDIVVIKNGKFEKVNFE